jgi:hypothetical protein
LAAEPPPADGGGGWGDLSLTKFWIKSSQIDHRVSVVLPDDEERLTFGGDVMQKKVTDTPTWACFEVLGDLGIDAP